MSQTIVDLSAIDVRYGHHQVLTNVDLQLSQGELFALVGPSGAGKSTLLRVLAGLQRPTSGRVRRPEDYGGATRTVFQAPHLLPWRTVAGNVRLGLEYRANGGRFLGDKTTANQRVSTILSELGIADLAYRYPPQLSGGQAQRVAVARAVVAHPTLLLLDEPFGALDPLTRTDLQDWLRAVHDRLGLSTILVTHDLEEALLLGDRVGILHAEPGPLDIVASPVTTRADLADGAARRDLLTRFASAAEQAELIGTDAGAAATSDPRPDGPVSGEPVDPSARPPIGAGRATRRELLTVAGAIAALSVPVIGSAFTGSRATADDQRANGRNAPGAGQVTTGQPATLRIGYLPITDAAPLLLAHDAGQFAARNIDTPAPILYRGWAALAEALQGDNVDIVHLLMPMAVQLRYDAQVPVKVLAWNHTNGSALTVAHSVNSIDDLAGTTFAIPAWFSVHNIVFQKLLREAGIRPVIDTPPSTTGRTVQLVVMPPADMPVALKSGSISGYIVAEPFCAVAEVLKIGKILRFTGDVWKDHACCVTVVRESLVRDHPDVALRAAEAIVATQLTIRDNREAAAERLSAGRYLPQPLPALKRTLALHQDPAYVSSGAVRHPAWQSRRIDFQPYPYPGYTDQIVQAMKETIVDADVRWLSALDPASVHGALVATDISSAAVDAAGGLAAFGLDKARTEVIEP